MLHATEKQCTFSEMINKSHIVGYVREHARHPVKGQRTLMADHGIAKVYTDLAMLIRQRRKGSAGIVAVKRMMLLADPKALRKGGGMRHSLRAAVAAIEAAGETILELDTGRRRDDPLVSEAMMLDAWDDLARTRETTRDAGRPKRVWSDEQRTIMQIHWRDLRHRTNRDAVAAINASGVKCSVSQVIKLLGASGRALGPK